jgi:hypothetical protein
MAETFRTYRCPLCGSLEQVSFDASADVYAQILMHINECTPIQKSLDTSGLLATVVSIAESILREKPPR